MGVRVGRPRSKMTNLLPLPSIKSVSQAEILISFLTDFGTRDSIKEKISCLAWLLRSLGMIGILIAYEFLFSNFLRTF
ncbi:hypothetical protein AOQ84DRAFT_62844 [Glonium stellatum]|uniref:Uncharacterized protein n=1 Tax=Glonium stellatum TaxID=574774 RepID=A0A8E2EYD9_9PEZI|nr:hypothetical protein AOQ84DRAFT_62844 [Glonium stellatum]